MKKNIAFITGIYLLLSSCLSTDSNITKENGLSKSEIVNYTKVRCFEVLIEKSKKDNLEYDKPLNWDSVNYRVRNDDYISLGTAFAINENELITAAHVMYLSDNSIVYPKRFIREKIRTGNETIEKVYEIDQIQAFNNHKDYVLFTVKDKTFEKWFETEENFQLDSKIYTVGNAYGEGIVTREGALLDIIPENENGEWNYLKSSIATNPGNSGGPLLNSNLQVVGVVLSKKDDFCYSLPIGEINREEAKIHSKFNYGFLTFNDKISSSFDLDLKRPAHYRDFIVEYWSSYNHYYMDNMDELFEDNKDHIFPKGKSSQNALYGANPSIRAQLIFEDNDNRTWQSTGYKYDSTTIDENGEISFVEFYKDAKQYFIEITKPENITLKDLYDSPKLQMDLILQGNNVTRKLSNSDTGSRVLSYGEPEQMMDYIDSYSRKWKINIWIQQHSDVAIINITTPIPTGLTSIYQTTMSNQIDNVLYDLKKTLDFVNVSYYGTVEEWSEFLEQKEYLFFPLTDYILSYKEGNSIDFTTNRFSINTKDDVFEINKKNELYLYFDIYPYEGVATWNVRKFIMDGGPDSQNYLLFYRWNQPTEDLIDDFHNEWEKNIVKKSHPYNYTSYTDEGDTRIGTIYPNGQDNVIFGAIDPYAYSLIVGREGTIDSEEIGHNMDTFVSNLKFY